jgi:hypothetical protein
MSKSLVTVFAGVLCLLANWANTPSTIAGGKANAQESKSKSTGPLVADPAKTGATAESAKEKGGSSAAGAADNVVEPAKMDKQSSKKRSTTNASGKSASKAAGNTLRLPRYYAGIVDQEQKEAIYAVQLEYRSKIAELEEELSRVRRDEQAALEKLLTDSQKKLLAKKRSTTQDSAKADTTPSE